MFNETKKTQLKLFLHTLALISCILLVTSCDNKDKGYKAIETMTLSHEDGFVGDESCMECHRDEHKTWQGSHHDLAMQVANDKTVLGNFNNQSVTLDGVAYVFTKKGKDFWVHIREIDGTEKDYKISYTFGVTPLQQYLVDFDGGRKQVLRVTWDSKDNKWFHQYAGDTIDPHDWMHWTESSQNWNTMCAECHSTNLKKNYNLEEDQFNTTYSIINVSCEACHGAGERHIAWAKKFGNEEKEDHTFIKEGLSQTDQINMCAPCHSRRSRLVEYYIPNQPYADQYLVENLTTDLYYGDGQIKEEDYVYGSFIQSKMYHNNVKCTDCHNPHSLKLKKQGNDLCLQCHKTTYNTPSHHFHEGNSESTQCVSCHMTGRFYMGNDFRRDHSFRVPRPDQSVTYNTPNACTECHKDKSNQWASDWVVKWYGKTRPKHFSDAMLVSSKETISDAEKQNLLNFINDISYPAIARATVIENLRASIQADFSALLKSLNDPSPMVRFNAVRQFQYVSQDERIAMAAEHIQDSVRSVRIGAIQLIRGIDDSNLGSINRDQLQKVRGEYLQMLFTNADFSVGRVQLGDYYLQNNQLDDAIKQYQIALKKDQLIFPVYSNLATSYNLKGNNIEALNTLNKWISLEPQSSQAYYLRALLLFELKDDSAAIADLKKAIQLNPQNTRAMYNLATYYYQNKDFSQAESMINKALKIEPRNTDYSNLRVMILNGKGQ